MARRIKSRGSGKSINFASASNQKVDLGVDFIGTGNFTISGWINPRTVGETAGRIIDNGSTVVQLESSNRVRISRDGSTFVGSAVNSIVYKVWTHFACTSTAAGVSNTYINGVLSGTANADAGTPIAASTNLFIGTNSATSRDFNGKMDSMRMFNRVLTAAEIADLYYDGQPPQDLANAQLAYYNFDDNVLDQTGSPTAAIDQSMVVTTPVDSSNYSTSTFARTTSIRIAQSFVPTNRYLDSVVFRKGSESGTYTGTMKVSVQSDSSGSPDGTDLVSSTYSNAEWVALDLNTDISLSFASSRIQITPGTTYWLVFTSSTGDDTNFTRIYVNSNTAVAYGTYKTYNGSAWAGASRTMYFQILTTSLKPAYNGTVTGATYSLDVPMRQRMMVQPSTKCIDFAGGVTTDVVDAGADFIGVGDITISAWIFPRSTGGGGGGRIVTNGKANFQITATNRLNMQSDGSTNASSGNNSLVLNKWQHVAVTRNAAGTATFYVNAQTAGTIGLATGTPAAGSNNVLIGNAVAANRAWDGMMQNVMIHNRILTQQQIEDLYYQGTISSLPLGSFTFDNTLVNGVTGTAATATGTTYSTNVRSTARVAASNRLAVRDFGTALTFGADTDKVTITNTGGEVHDNLSNLTVSMWIKPYLLDDSSNFAFSIAATGGNNRRYIQIGSTGKLGINGGSTSISSTNVFQANKWYFVVARWNVITLKYDAYVNNVEWIPQTTWVLGTGNANIIIGSQGTAAQNFEGAIDQVRMFNRVLSATEMSEMYYNGSIPQGSSCIGEWKFDEGSGTTAIDTSGGAHNGTITGATYITSVQFTPRVSA